MTITQSKQISVDVDLAAAAERACDWASKSGFRLIGGERGSLEFHRGHSSASLWAFDIRHYPTTVRLHISDGKPLVASIAIEVQTGAALYITAADHRKVDELAKSIQDALEQNVHAAASDHRDRPDEWTVQSAYDALGVPATPDWDSVVKAYRAAAARYHPDKYHAMDLPPEMVRAAEERLRQIVDAFAFLKQRRSDGN
ncbi:MAG: DnaJ domain-containing protein [Phycisphaerales bacterium]|nr:DnaJ domain-containing protein [Phycisphaerales bacterium]